MSQIRHFRQLFQILFIGFLVVYLSVDAPGTCPAVITALSTGMPGTATPAANAWVTPLAVSYVSSEDARTQEGGGSSPAT